MNFLLLQDVMQINYSNFLSIFVSVITLSAKNNSSIQICFITLSLVLKKKQNKNKNWNAEEFSAVVLNHEMAARDSLLLLYVL